MIAVAIVIVVAAWMVSGYLPASGDAEPTADHTREAAQALMTVEVKEIDAETVERQLESQGEALPERTVQIRAETTGRVAKVMAQKGADVKAGDPLVSIAMNDRKARLAEARAVVEQRQADYEAAQKLGKQGMQAKTRVREAYAVLQSAKAKLSAIKEDIDNTTVRAPYDGILDDRAVDVGDYLSPGDPVATVVDNDPLKVVIHVAQQDVAKLGKGDDARVSLATGQKLTGRVTFIAAAADRETRTFRVEIEVDNPKGLPAGVSATVVLPTGTAKGHFLSPALLDLNEDGVLGAKTVDDSGHVHFHPVKLLRTERNGVWVDGLPDHARVITIGQGFVKSGEKVHVVSAGNDDIDMRPPAKPAEVPGATDG